MAKEIIWWLHLLLFGSDVLYWRAFSRLRSVFVFRCIWYLFSRCFFNFWFTNFFLVDPFFLVLLFFLHFFKKWNWYFFKLILLYQCPEVSFFIVGILFHCKKILPLTCTSNSLPIFNLNDDTELNSGVSICKILETPLCISSNFDPFVFSPSRIPFLK